MRPLDPTDNEPLSAGLFETWMGMTPEEWDALGSDDDDRDDG